MIIISWLRGIFSQMFKLIFTKIPERSWAPVTSSPQVSPLFTEFRPRYPSYIWNMPSISLLKSFAACHSSQTASLQMSIRLITHHLLVLAQMFISYGGLFGIPCFELELNSYPYQCFPSHFSYFTLLGSTHYNLNVSTYLFLFLFLHRRIRSMNIVILPSLIC